VVCAVVWCLCICVLGFGEEIGERADLCTGFVVRDSAILAAPRLGSVPWHGTVACRTVDFVSQKNKGELGRVAHIGVVGELFLPHPQVLKRWQISNIVAEHAAVRTAVEGCSQALEPLQQDWHGTVCFR
jgi:hypothetical protein